MSRRVFICLFSFFFLCFFVTAQSTAQEKGFQKNIDELILKAKKGDVEAKSNLFFIPVSSKSYEELSYLFYASWHNKDDAYFQSLMAASSFALGDEEAGFKWVEEFNKNDNFVGKDKYNLAWYLVIQGEAVKRDRYFKEALKMYRSLKQPKFKYMEDDINKWIIYITEKERKISTK